MKWPGAKQFAKKLYSSWNDDALSDTAAALTYWGVLSLFPFLLFSVALVGLVLDPQTINNLVQQLSTVAPAQVAQILGERLTSLQQNSSGGILSFAIVFALWTASSAVDSLTAALNRCYDVRETRPFWKTRALSLMVTIAGGLAVVLGSAILFGVPVIGYWMGGTIGTMITWLRFPVAGLIMSSVWATLYWILPNVRPRFQLITVGSVAGVVVWLAASWGFSEYVRHFGKYEATYGTIGGVIVLLIWMWLSSLVILLGAEVNKILTPAARP